MLKGIGPATVWIVAVMFVGGLPLVVALAGAGLVVSAPVRPAQMVGWGTGRVGVQPVEQALGFGEGERDQAVSAGRASTFARKA